MLLVLLKSWTEEITKYIYTTITMESYPDKRFRHVYGGLNVCEYHGRGRESKPQNIANYDIVISTYHTLASENENPKITGLLFKINWFRVVLDEGMFCPLATP